MEIFSVLERPSVLTGISDDCFIEKLRVPEITSANPVLSRLLSEGCNDFYRYLKWLGLAAKQDIMILSSIHHYYYDLDDLCGVKILININKLNQIKHLDSFLATICRILPLKAFLIGCFQDNKNNVGRSPAFDSSWSSSCKTVITGPAAAKSLSEQYVSGLLERNGFRLSDISSLSGVHFFCSQNIRNHN